MFLWIIRFHFAECLHVIKNNSLSRKCLLSRTWKSRMIQIETSPEGVPKLVGLIYILAKYHFTRSVVWEDALSTWLRLCCKFSKILKCFAFSFCETHFLVTSFTPEEKINMTFIWTFLGFAINKTSPPISFWILGLKTGIPCLFFFQNFCFLHQTCRNVLEANYFPHIC